MRTNYSGNKRKKEEARRKKQEEKRNKRLAKSQGSADLEPESEMGTGSEETPQGNTPENTSENTY